MNKGLHTNNQVYITLLLIDKLLITTQLPGNRPTLECNGRNDLTFDSSYFSGSPLKLSINNPNVSTTTLIISHDIAAVVQLQP